MSSLNEKLLPEVLSGLEAMTAIRRDLHAHPELGMCEVRTAKIAADALRAMGCDEVVEGIGKTGVAAGLRGGQRKTRPLFNLARSAHLDARPHAKPKGAPHDGHVAGVLLAAHALVKRRENLAGDVVLIIQPGEEGYAGAREMIEDGLFERFPVDEIYGVHCAGELPLGVIGFTKGAQCAAADHFRITVKGVGGHGARPHKTVDPVVASGILIGALQTIVSRSVDPMRPAVVTIASIHGGDPQGVSVVPAEVKLAGTTRCAYPEERDLIERRMGEICAGVAATTGTEIDFQYVRLYPPLVNHDEQLEFARQVALEAYGEERVRSHAASMGAEDFAFFLEKRPGCFPRVGIADETHTANHHHPNFDYNDLALGPTADFFVRLVEKRLAALQ